MCRPVDQRMNRTRVGDELRSGTHSTETGVWRSGNATADAFVYRGRKYPSHCLPRVYMIDVGKCGERVLMGSRPRCIHT